MNDKKIASPILGRLHIEVFDADAVLLAETTTDYRSLNPKIRSSKSSLALPIKADP